MRAGGGGLAWLEEADEDGGALNSSKRLKVAVLFTSGEPIPSLNLLFASLSFSRIRKVTPKDFRIWDFRDAFPFLRDIMRFSRSSGVKSAGMVANAV